MKRVEAQRRCASTPQPSPQGGEWGNRVSPCPNHSWERLAPLQAGARFDKLTTGGETRFPRMFTSAVHAATPHTDKMNMSFSWEGCALPNPPRRRVVSWEGCALPNPPRRRAMFTSVPTGIILRRGDGEAAFSTPVGLFEPCPSPRGETRAARGRFDAEVARHPAAGVGLTLLRRRGIRGRAGACKTLRHTRIPFRPALRRDLCYDIGA